VASRVAGGRAEPYPVAVVGGPKIERDPTLSVCCLTRGPTARVAAQLELLRDVATEIVVGLDTSVPADLAGPLAAVADVLVHYPYADPVDRPVGWIHSLCTGDWILWVDDDEIPSAALVRAVREIPRETSVTHCFVPRRTLWRDPESVLLGAPWVPDFQLRLVQNDPRVVWFPGITHWPIQALGPHRYLDAPLYHTDLLLNPVERRREKVRRYETAVPGRRVAGLPMNDAYFLPEDRAEIRLAAVADEDRETVLRLLALEPWPDSEKRPASIRLASRDEIDGHWHGAPADADLYRGAIELLDELEPFSVGEERGVMVRVSNRGSHVWPHGSLGWPSVRVSYRWLDDEGGTAVADGLRTPLPETLAPGASLTFPLDVLAPPVAGSHSLVLDLLHEPVRWFGCEVSAAARVHRAVCIAILGEDEAVATAAAAALAEVAPGARPLLLAPSPERTTAVHGYAAAPDARSYVLGSCAGRGRLLATAAALARASALVGDAALYRLGTRPRLAARAGAGFLDGLADADALIVVGDAVLQGWLGEREALQQRAAVLAARTLGLETVVVARDDLRAELAKLVRRLELRTS
jgi:hypothetical protein